MDTKTALIFGGLAFLGVVLIRNADKRNAQNADAETSDLNDDPTRQALAFKDLLDANDNFNWWSVNNISSKDDIAALYNLCLTITDWAEVQRKFLVLTKNERRLTDCLQDACTDNEVFNKALEIAGAQKVELTQDTTVVFYDKDGQRVDKSMSKGTRLGAIEESNDMYIAFINRYWVDGIFFKDLIEVTGVIAKNCAKII